MLSPDGYHSKPEALSNIENYKKKQLWCQSNDRPDPAIMVLK